MKQLKEYDYKLAKEYVPYWVYIKMAMKFGEHSWEFTE